MASFRAATSHVSRRDVAFDNVPGNDCCVAAAELVWQTVARSTTRLPARAGRGRNVDAEGGTEFQMLLGYSARLGAGAEVVAVLPDRTLRL